MVVLELIRFIGYFKIQGKSEIKSYIFGVCGLAIALTDVDGPVVGTKLTFCELLVELEGVCVLALMTAWCNVGPRKP